MSHFDDNTTMLSRPNLFSLKTFAVPMMDQKRLSMPGTPTSGSSVGTPSDNPFTQHAIPAKMGPLRIPGKFNNDECQSAMFKPMARGNGFLSTLQSVITRHSDAMSSSSSTASSPEVRNEFDVDFYQRIEDFLDEQGLNITMPSNEHSENQMKAEVRKLIAIRTLSENLDLGLEAEFDFETDDFTSPSLRRVATSSLLQRRKSSNNLPEPSSARTGRSNVAKKSFRIVASHAMMAISEENTPCATRRDSIMPLGCDFDDDFPQERSNRKNTIEPLDDLKNAVWKRIGCMGQLEDESEPKNSVLLRMSPAMKPIATFNLKPASFMTPQTNNFRKPNERIIKNSALSDMAKKFRNIEKAPTGFQAQEKDFRVEHLLSTSSLSESPM